MEKTLKFRKMKIRTERARQMVKLTFSYSFSHGLARRISCCCFLSYWKISSPVVICSTLLQSSQFLWAILAWLVLAILGCSWWMKYKCIFWLILKTIPCTWTWTTRAFHKLGKVGCNLLKLTNQFNAEFKYEIEIINFSNYFDRYSLKNKFTADIGKISYLEIFKFQFSSVVQCGRVA